MKLLLVVLSVILTSLYYFPIQFTYILPGINTKIMTAVIGIVLFLYDLVKNGQAQFDKNLFTLILYSFVVSLCGFFSVVFNNTNDLAYAGYIGSMLVWFAGAYAVVRLIKMVHGEVNVRLITNYLIAVCVMQCVAAILNDQIPAFKSFVDRNIQQGQEFINGLVGVKRKYGIGANLDTAGIRFSAVLCMIPIVASRLSDALKRKWLWLYVLAFLFITVEGNVISRTTIVGSALGLMCVIIYFKSYRTESRSFNSWLLFSVSTLCLLSAASVIYLFNTNAEFENDIRFGFEGFFSLSETGEWNVSSNDRLRSMYVWPDNLKTWLIGDGYFSNPLNTDPYFIGKITGGYYMGTDVGFLRFIYYFGVIGLMAFGAFFIKCGQICARIYPRYTLMFWLMVTLNFLIWFKVSTDLFCVFALFIAANQLSQPAKYDKSEVLCV